MATLQFELKADVHAIYSSIRRPDCRAYADQSRQPDRGTVTDTCQFIHRYAQTKNFPSKPVTIVVPFTAGSGSDTSARFFGEQLSKTLNQSFIVENRPGASGIIAVSAVKNAPADGHMILLASNSPIAVNPVTIKDLPYDPLKDLKPISGVTRGMNALVVAPGSPIKTIAELVPMSQPTPYLQRKGIAPQSGVLTDRAGRITVVLGIDADGKPWTMQTIYEDGTKRFARDSRKEGCFHAVGGLPALAQAPALVISEGYATAVSLSQALGFATVAAFDAGNLMHVAKVVQKKYPDKPVIIAGDDDRHLELTHGENRGRVKAQEAAVVTGGHLLLPVFAPGEGSYPAGLAPVTPKTYREHLRTGGGLTEAQLAALEQMKRHTDFNDLATTSVLGKEAINRQVRAFVTKVLDQHEVGMKHPLQQSQYVRSGPTLQPR
jgi:hypothetical protein